MSTVLTISIEIELGWGVHDISRDSHLSNDGKTERQYLKQLLSKSEETNIPISFDIVGHLLLNECNGSHPGPYSDGWFDSDPGTNKEEHPLFYAPEIAEWICQSPTDHELCTHTFSHILLNECSDELIAKEIDAVNDTHSEFGNSVKSLVPPRHERPADNSILAQSGIKTVRYSKRQDYTTKLVRFKQLIYGPHPEWTPKSSEGVLETYCTAYPSLTAPSLPAGQKESAHPAFSIIPVDLRTALHLRYLKKATKRAIRSGNPLHLWCHLYDLSNQHQWNVVSDYFDFLATLPESELEIRTMDELPEVESWE